MHGLLNKKNVKGRRIGLFGGSFNPAHEGHFDLAKTALVRLRLDLVWWMVSPQNPLKPADETGDFNERMKHTAQIARHPKFIVTDIEKKLGTTSTAQTLFHLAPLLDQGNFVWLMGADSFAGLDRWINWQAIPNSLPMAVFDRPGWGRKALASKPAKMFKRYQIDAEDAALLADLKSPAWAFIPMPQNSQSSSRIRNLRPQ